MTSELKEAVRLYDSGRIEPALTVLLSLEAEVGQETELAYYLGLCYARLKRYDEALLFLEQVVTSTDDSQRISQCRFVLAYIYAITDQARLAEYELGQLLDSGNLNASVYSALGYTAYEQGKTEEALDFYRKALELDPENPAALNSAGYIMANENIDLKQALSYCRKALDMDPDNAAYLDSVGWAFYMSGMAERGRVFLERASRQAPGVALIQRHYRQVKEAST